MESRKICIDEPICWEGIDDIEGLDSWNIVHKERVGQMEQSSIDI